MSLKWPAVAELTKYLSYFSQLDLIKKYGTLLLKAQALYMEEQYDAGDEYRLAADDIIKWFETGDAAKYSR
jgi:hypothetical protein